MVDTELLRRIVTDPKIMAGEPVIRGTRLTVEHILRRLGQGTTVEELTEEYPGLAKEDVWACFLFASRSLENMAFMPLATEAA